MVKGVLSVQAARYLTLVEDPWCKCNSPRAGDVTGAFHGKMDSQPIGALQEVGNACLDWLKGDSGTALRR